jgi:hypothetical protein
MGVINRGHEWNSLDDVTTSEFEDSKTLKAVMFLMIKEHVKKIPNDQELGKEIRELINNYKLNTDVNG